MPHTTATITKDQRNGLYELIRDHLGGLGDVWIAMEKNRDFATAERLGRELGGDMRLLDDLGWHEDDEREAIELTMPAEAGRGAEATARRCRQRIRGLPRRAPGKGRGRTSRGWLPSRARRLR